MIKKMFFLLIGFFLIFSFLPAQGVQEDTQEVEISENIPEPAHITYIEGMVKLNTENAEVNLPVVSSDELKTEDGRVEICLNGNYFRLDKNTHVVFIGFQEESVTLTVKQGNIYARTEIKVTVQTPHKEFTFSAGLHLIRVTATTAECLSNPLIKDDFDYFNEQRERELDPINTAQTNLPEELGEYESELSHNGEWRHHERYGNVWVPNVDYGWRPYYYGRWSYVPILGWFWVSFEPFGWCTYHYGRWHWDPFWGSWYWIPTTIWGPAWVNWYGYGNYWGWCPTWYDRWYFDRYYDSYYRYGYGRAWTFIRKDQLRNRNIHTVAARRSELQSMSQINSTQLLRKSVSPTLNQISPNSRQISRGAISSRNIGGSIQNRQTQSQIRSRITPKSTSTTRIQNYPSRITSRNLKSFTPNERRISPTLRNFSRLDSLRRSFSPTQRFLAPQTSRFSAVPRSFSPSRSFSAPSRSSSLFRSRPSRSPSGSSPRRKN